MQKNVKKDFGLFLVTYTATNSHHKGKKFEEQHKQYAQETEQILNSKKTNDEETIQNLVNNLREERSIIDEARKKELAELDKKRYQGMKFQ